MRIDRLETLLKDTLAGLDHPEIASVETVAEAGYAENPQFGKYGLVVTFTDQSGCFVRFLGTSAPGGDRMREDADDGTPDKTREWEEARDVSRVRS